MPTPTDGTRVRIEMQVEPMRTAILVLLTVGVASVGTADAAARITSLPCAPDRSGARELVLKSRPTNCLTLSPHASLAGAEDLRGLHWRRWGSEQAFATGINRGFHRPIESVRVTVIADHFAYAACGGQRYYSHLKVTSRYGTGNYWIAPGCEYATYAKEFVAAATATFANFSVKGLVNEGRACDLGSPGRWRCSATYRWTQPDNTTFSGYVECRGTVQGFFRGYKPVVTRDADCESR